eukprot:2615301-Pleurochrysis_carterae.AAC.4
MLSTDCIGLARLASGGGRLRHVRSTRANAVRGKPSARRARSHVTASPGLSHVLFCRMHARHSPNMKNGVYPPVLQNGSS